MIALVHPNDQLSNLPPLPPYASAGDVARRSLPSLNPASRISVTAAAVEHMKVNAGGRWVDFDPDTTPYMVEPANMSTSRLYRELIFVGPARAGKTVCMMQCIAHLIVCDPGVCHVTHMTETTGQLWEDEELLPMIQNSPALDRRQGLGVSDRNKRNRSFIGGAKVTIGPPTKENLSGRTIRLVMFTDLDRMKLSIGSEGSPFAMGAKRNETLGSRGMTLAESSPGHNIKDPDWEPQTPHEAPPCDGILDLYNGGTRARWYWDCPGCGEAFEAHFRYLEYDQALPPAEAGQAAVMVCPHNGCVISHRQKVTLNRAGYWLHEDGKGGLARIESGDVLQSARLSYHLNGAAASFASWARIVSKFLAAKLSAKQSGDYEPLRVTVNTDQGDAFLPPQIGDEQALKLSDVNACAIDLPRGHAPEWTRFIIISLDVQKQRFVGAATAYGLNGARMVIDRFDIHTPPDTAPNHADRVIDPATYPEDWEALTPLLDRVFPVAGGDFGLHPVAVGCDFHGEAGVSDNAEKFWLKRKAAGEQRRWFMIRGHGGFRVDGRHWYKAPTRANDGGKARKIKLLNIATDRYKDTTIAGFGRNDAGAASMSVGSWMIEDHRREFTAEYRTDKGWLKRRGMPRNESIDLASYAQAVAEHLGLLKIDAANPPDWARGGVSNLYGVPLTADGQAVARADAEPAPRPTQINYLR